MCLNSMIEGFAPMGLGSFSYTKGYKGFAPTELIQLNQKQSQRDEILVEKPLISNIRSIGAVPKKERQE